MSRGYSTTSPLSSPIDTSSKRSREDSPSDDFLRSAKVVVTERKQCQQENDQLKTKIAETQEILNKQEKDLISRDEDLDYMRKLNDEKTENLQKYKEYIIRLKSSRASLMSTNAGLNSGTITLTSENANLASANTKLSSDNAKLRAVAAKFAAKCAQLESTITTFQRDAEVNSRDIDAENGELGALNLPNIEMGQEEASLEVATDVAACEPERPVNPNTSTDVTMSNMTAAVEEMELGETGPEDPRTFRALRLKIVFWQPKLASLGREKVEEVLRQVFDMLCVYDVKHRSNFKRTILSALAGTMVPYVKPTFRAHNDVFEGNLRYWNQNLTRATDGQLKKLLGEIIRQTLDENFQSKMLWRIIARGIWIDTSLEPAQHLLGFSYDDLETDSSDNSDDDSSDDSYVRRDSDMDSDYEASDDES
ncbi:hypothetical protein FKW77_001037 [Venturia effusa]|uniref:Uncharacterized protein n=1 Tax=Venturia effusa TaxID=50376 RepID=A0A517LAD1_9PEZI|nr:hypothetical protein FKW77_001037 [Venturia effusa]